MCVLMLRGPQTPGELKQRGERMHPFAGLDEVQTTLARLIERGLAERLARRPGQKEERYRELLGAEEDEQATAEPQPVGHAEPAAPRDRDADAAAVNGASSLDAGLVARVARLEREVAELRELLGERAGEPA